MEKFSEINTFLIKTRYDFLMFDQIKVCIYILALNVTLNCTHCPFKTKQFLEKFKCNASNPANRLSLTQNVSHIKKYIFMYALKYVECRSLVKSAFKSI